MTETWDAIRARRNVRDYTDEPIPAEHLDRILEAGRLAPSAGNRQHWDLVVVTGREELRELATVWRSGGHVAVSAATVALVLPEVESAQDRDFDQYDLGQLTYAMTLAATDLGIGTGHTAVGDQDKARALLGVPDTHYVPYLLALGYPKDRPLTPLTAPKRRPFDEVVHRGTW